MIRKKNIKKTKIEKIPALKKAYKKQSDGSRYRVYTVFNNRMYGIFIDKKDNNYIKIGRYFKKVKRYASDWKRDY